MHRRIQPIGKGEKLYINGLLYEGLSHIDCEIRSYLSEQRNLLL